MIRLLKEKESINVVNDQLGCPTYAADLAEIIMQFIDRIEQNSSFDGIVNYCNEGVISWFDFAVAIKKILHSSCEIIPVPTTQYPTPAKRPQYSVLDTSKIKEMLHTDIPFWENSLYKCLQLLSATNSR